MRVLLLAPQPFYQERGTPIAVRLLIRALTERGDEVDLVTFPEGEDVSYEGLTIHRCRPWPPVGHVKPGFSWRKIVCDLALWRSAAACMRRRRYDVVHAVEESAFIAQALCAGTSTPFVYDMDSSMSDQLVQGRPWMRGFYGLLRAIEARPMRAAAAVVPMCDALADVARQERARRVHILKDVSLADPVPGEVESLRETLGIDGPIVMYIGNLERYQGIDLLVDAFARAVERVPEARLVIIGGSDADVARYREEISRGELSERAFLVGRRPVRDIAGYMQQADVLVSPRVEGTNTPMKIYSYLDSGVAVLATDLPTHTQVATPEVAKLAAAEPVAYGRAMAELLERPAERASLAAAARALIRREHSYEAFRRGVDALYDELAENPAR